MTGNKSLAAPIDDIKDSIFTIRDVQVMLDSDLALMYDVETRLLNQAVKRNNKRFPKEFMSQLTVEELEEWKSQIVISNKEVMGIRNIPFLFTEQGVSMLLGIQKSDDPEYSTVSILATVQREGSHQENHFEEVHEMVTIGSSSRKRVKSNTLTSYACRAIMEVVDFMVSQNAIPSRKYLAFFKMNKETFDLRSQVVTSRG